MVGDQSRRVEVGPLRPESTGAAARVGGAGAGSSAGFAATRRLDELLAEATHAGRLAGILLAALRSERLGTIAADREYRLPSLARLLALGAEERLDAAPAEAEEYAELALAVALALPRPAAERQLRTSCAWLLGMAQLRTGKLAAAEASFGRLDGRGGAGERALAAAGLAQLRWQQRRTADAWALLVVATRVFADLHDGAAVCACRSLCGFLLLGNGELQLARLELRAARRVIECSRAPSLDVLLCLALAHCELALGGTAAPDFLALARDASRACMAPAVLGQGAWWNAVTGLGLDVDEAQVDEARHRALAGGDLGTAARATLWLTMRRIAAAQGKLAAALAAPLAALGDQGAIWSVEITVLASLAVARPPAYMQAARELALRLAVEAIPGLAAQCPPRGVCDLANRLLLLHSEPEQPPAEAGGPW
jgi:hypothetical protein